MVSRYSDRKVGINSTEQYKSILRKKKLSFIRQHFTPTLKHPTSSEVAQLTIVGETWSIGTRMSTLAQKHYGSAEDWWVIAWFNQKPTDAHFRLGDIVRIPFPLEKVLDILEA